MSIPNTPFKEIEMELDGMFHNVMVSVNKRRN